MSAAAKNGSLTVEWWPIGKVKPYPKNPRKPSDKAVAKVMASIQEFGWRQPIVVDKKGVIVAGHKRWEAAGKLSLDRVPVHVAANLTATQLRQYRIMDNRAQDDSEWDLDLLSGEIAELHALENVDLALTGFDEPELVQFLAHAGAQEGLTPEDEAPEPPVEPTSKLGDLWLLGRHRVLCGDSTDAESVKRLMAGEKAALMATDPPYGIAYNSADLHQGNSGWSPVLNDELKDAELQKFLEGAFSAALGALNENAAWYLWHAMLTQGFFAAAAVAAAAHVILHRQIIWVKPVLVFGRGFYHWKHELCFMGWVEGHRPPDYGDHTETTVWEVAGVSDAERKKFLHATPKPVELFRRPIIKHTQTGEICYEPFAGSGPQVIAAEMTARRCFALELAPQYIDVIVNRWQNFTGQRATLEGDGRTFDEVQAERTSGSRTADKRRSAPGKANDSQRLKAHKPKAA